MFRTDVSDENGFLIGEKDLREVPSTVRYHQETINQIIQSVEEGTYCAVLGPRLCGKTLLLRYLEQNIAVLHGWTCAFIDLEGFRATTQQAFFADLINLTAESLTDLTGKSFSIPDESDASSVVFRAFLTECLDVVGHDLVLIFDPLEALPTDLVQGLLTSLRAAYMDQQNMDIQLTVIVSGALSLATLTVGKSSPLGGIARRVFVDDLTRDNSETLIQENLSQNNIPATRPAIGRLLQATSGDIFLIRKLTQCCIDLVQSRQNRQLRTRDVNYITNRFLKAEVLRYAPLIEAVLLIEEDPDLLQCILLLLEQKRVHRASLPLPLSPDLDPLYLTGVIERDGEDNYQIQNDVYHRYLSSHFSPGRVGHVLALTGRWDFAMEYLHASIEQGNDQSRLDLLSAAINSMYASENLDQAVLYLRRGLVAAFGVEDAYTWVCLPQEQHLQLVGEANSAIPTFSGVGQNPAVNIPIHADRLEARSYRQQVLLRGQEGENKVIRAIPLKIPGQKPIGVVTILDSLENLRDIDPRDRDTQLVGFINQAARALQTVNIRRQELVLAGKMQASLLPVSFPNYPGWEITASWRPARETSGDFYDLIPLDENRIGIVIADVVDKGLGPALLMTLSRTLIRTFAAETASAPEILLKLTNLRLLSDINLGIFVTLFYGVLDLNSGELNFSNAGQPPPLLFPGDQRQEFTRLEKTGMALGVSEDESWSASSINIPPGSLILLYTDGVLDARNANGDYFGDLEMANIALNTANLSAEEVRQVFLSGIYNYSRGGAQADDITLMVLKRNIA